MYLQTLHRMYIVNAGPGFKKMLWPAAQKLLDSKTIAKIQVRLLAKSCQFAIGLVGYYFFTFFYFSSLIIKNSAKQK